MGIFAIDAGEFLVVLFFYPTPMPLRDSRSFVSNATSLLAMHRTLSLKAYHQAHTIARGQSGSEWNTQKFKSGIV